jgi:uncharacterized DUF497 family protein
MNFEWDPEKDRITRKIHGISFSASFIIFIRAKASSVF